MPFRTLTAVKPIVSSIMSEIPAVPAENGKAVNDGVPGKELNFPGLPTPKTQTQEGGLPADAPAARQPSPQDANVLIDDTTFYVMDANDPEGSRAVGLQVREAFHRARQVDTLQSQLHSTQNENQTLQQQQVANQARIKELETEAAVTQQLRRMGVSPPAAQDNPPAAPQSQQPGVLTPQGTPQADSWDYDAGTPAVYGYQEDATAPQAPQQQPVPQTQNVLSSNPQEFARQLLPMVSQLIDEKFGNFQSQIQQSTQAGIEQLQQERAVEDRISSTLQAARQTRAQDLQRLNLSDERTTNILDKEDMATVLHRESELLLSEGSQENVVAAQKKLRQAAELQSSAANDRAAAQIAFQNTEAERQFEQNFETDQFAALDVEPQEVNYDLTDPRAIHAFNEANAEKASELAVARERVESQTGRTL